MKKKTEGAGPNFSGLISLRASWERGFSISNYRCSLNLNFVQSSKQNQDWLDVDLALLIYTHLLDPVRSLDI